MSAAPTAGSASRPTLFASYAPLPGTFDELFSAPGAERASLGQALAALLAVRPEEFARAQALAELSLLNQGVTFSVYADQRGAREDLPVLPRPAHRLGRGLAQVERGLEQRIRALEALLRRRLRRAAHPRREAHASGSRARRQALPAGAAAACARRAASGSTSPAST